MSFPTFLHEKWQGFGGSAPEYIIKLAAINRRFVLQPEDSIERNRPLVYNTYGMFA